MPEARDRLSRSSDDVVAEAYIRRRTSITTTGVLPDLDDNERSLIQTPFRWGSTPLTGAYSAQPTGGAALSSASSTSIRASGSGRGLFGSPMTTAYRRGHRSQNTPSSSSGTGFRRSRGGERRSSPLSVLPSWYPRTPLRDITPVVRAIERRRGLLGDGEGQTMETPTPSGVAQVSSQLDAQLEHKTPLHSKACKSFKMGKVPLIIHAFANKDEGDSELLTPQKKLLNSIEIVEKVVMEELNRLKRTPSARKAERERKVRTLMSMR